jgi:hypothetical protein
MGLSQSRIFEILWFKLDGCEILQILKFIKKNWHKIKKIFFSKI